MDRLVEEVSEAARFCQEVWELAKQRPLFPGEEFEEIVCGILATDQADAHGDVASVEVLQGMVESLRDKLRWAHAHHNPLIQPVGRNLGARLFYSEKSQTHFVVLACGYYSPRKLPSFSDIGIDVTELGVDEDIRLSKTHLRCRVGFNPREIKPHVIERILNKAPEFVERKPAEQVRKALDFDTVILTIWLSTPFIAFSKKLLEKSAEKMAESFVEWIKHVAKEVDRLRRKKVIIKFETEYQGCRIEYLIESRYKKVIADAASSLADAEKCAVSLIHKLEPLQPDLVVLRFDSGARCWRPLHAATAKAGVISDQPVLVALENFRGFSYSAEVMVSTKGIKGIPVKLPSQLEKDKPTSAPRHADE